MERPSPSTKKRKRQRQKVRRRQKVANAHAGNTTDSSEADRYKEYVVGRILPYGFGEDTDVLHMKLEDFYQGWEENAEYSRNYLLECREQLVRKVESYRRKIEELCTDKTETALKHRKEIEDIRTFYQNIAYGTSRSGTIVKKANHVQSKLPSRLQDSVVLAPVGSSF